jgi:hypothetical protein
MTMMGDPGIEAVRRSRHYSRILWGGRIFVLGIVALLTGGLLINTSAGCALFGLGFLFFIVAYFVAVLAVRKVWREIPRSELSLVMKSAVAGVQMDVFRRKPPMDRR